MTTRIRDLLSGGRERPDGFGHHTVGNALVLHADEEISPEAQSLALSVAEDPEHDVVVLDLGDGVPIGAWESMAWTLPRRRRGIRLVACGRHRAMTAMAAQWLSERLHRTVLAPDGDLVRGYGGVLFVHSTPHSGWIRFQPGQSPVWEAKRYPAPMWDRAATQTRQSSAAGAVEPMPAGVWIRDSRHAETLAEHRRRLVDRVPCQPEHMTVVLGCPGTPPLSLDDVVRFWRELDEDARERTRFVQYGEVRLPEGEPLGQALADVLGTTVVCYTGLPIGGQNQLEVRTVHPDGQLGWAPFALELVYVPRTHPNTRARRPTIRSHRPPLPDSDELTTRVYWFAADAVLEVVPAGIWVRTEPEPANAEQVRAARLDVLAGRLIYDDTVDSRTTRMRELALDLAAQVRGLPGAGALVPASRLAPASRPAGRGLAVVDESPDQARYASQLPTYVEVTLAQPVATESTVPFGQLPAVPAPALALAAAPTAVPAAAPPAPAAMPPPGPVLLPDPIPVPDPVPVAVAQSVAPPPARSSARQVTVVIDDPVVQISGPVVEIAGPVAPITEPITAPLPAAPAVGVWIQPVPAAGGSAVLSGRGLTGEREWLRSRLSGDFDAMASSVSRIMSEHPGLQNVGLSSTDSLTDCVAVRLYLTHRGPGIDAGLRSARNGPHVPFARCVVAGLSRMPSYRGSTVYRSTVTPPEWELYRERALMTDWAFVNTMTQPCATQDGDTDVLIWSMTARRTTLLEPDDDTRIEGRVVFLPGTSFKVLDLLEPSDGQRGAVFLREINSSEIDDGGRVDPSRVSLDELATVSLRRNLDEWTGTPAGTRIGAGARGRRLSLPGLDRKE